MKKKKVSRLREDIMTRCYNPKSIMYEHYGGRGIKVCDEWHDLETFKKWAFDNGFDGTQRIERIDPNKNYCPENCILGTRFIKKANLQLPLKKRRRKKKEMVLSEHPLNVRYRCMRQRCENPKNKDYKDYGARGISVCDEWRGRGGEKRFIDWAETSGYKEGLTIDRIDNNGDYSPDNCRWVTVEQQQQNRRGVSVCMYGDELMTVGKIARIEGVPYTKVKRMLTMLGVEMQKIE